MLRRARQPLQYVGIDELGGRPHVMVDGAERPSSTLVLSHWPHTPTPRRLYADLSTEIAFSYLRERRIAPAALVTCDHLDEDGLASLAVLTRPAESTEHETLLTGLARAGDFGVVRCDREARLAFLIHVLFDPRESPYAAGAGASELGGNQWTARCYEHLLDELFGRIDNLDRIDSSYEAEWSSYQSTRKALESGRIELEEEPTLGLCVVRVAPTLTATEQQIGHGATVPFHPYVVHSATAMVRMLVCRRDSFVYYDRYETWVRYMSRRLLLRRDMAPLATALSDLEGEDNSWTSDPPSSLEPVLTPTGGATALSESTVLSVLKAHLAHAPSAWDPFARAR